MALDVGLRVVTDVQVSAQAALAPVQPSLMDSYLEVVDTVHKAVNVAGEILSTGIKYTGIALKGIAKVLAYPVVFIVGGVSLLLWKGGQLVYVGIARSIHALDGVLNRRPDIN